MLEELAVRKAIALFDRAEARDFTDVYGGAVALRKFFADWVVELRN